MPDRNTIGALMCAITLAAAGVVHADEASKYPDLSGWWLRIDTGHGASWDPGKSAGLRQEAPLTPEYQAILEASLADQARGGQGNNSMAECTQPGMPRTMTDYEGMEFIVTPATTYIMLVEPVNHLRRIYTDGRAWPARTTPSLLGYSIGQWHRNSDGRFDVLEAETRGFRGPREFESSGLPLHADNQSIVQERIYLDAGNPDILRDEITTFDHALTRPWTVLKGYRRVRRPGWTENICGEENHHVFLGKENYYISVDGYLMPTRKDQPPPDLRYFEKSQP